MDKNFLRDFLRDLFKPKNKNALNKILMIFLLGVGLLLLGSSFGENEELTKGRNEIKEIKEIEEEPITDAMVHTTKEDSIEKQLEEILSKVEGAGAVDVFITYGSTEEKILAENTKIEKDISNNQGGIVVQEEREVVLIEGNIPYVLVEQAPKIEGVIVVAEGGDNGVVRQGLHSGVQALFDVDAHKIVILKMK